MARPLLVRDNIIICLARYMLSPVHRSICLSVWVDQSKMAKLGLRDFQHTIPLILSRKFHPEILTGSPDLAVKQGRGVENKPSEILGSKRIVVTSLTF